ncbi:hypothetical protein M0805_000281 [Coniferiporia weirii]|nr:hypothetical protein M0805_000281 [Coniferiporia weirii]
MVNWRIKLIPESIRLGQGLHRLQIQTTSPQDSCSRLALQQERYIASPFAMFRKVRNLASEILYHLWTLILFTKSDIKTTVIPITSLAVASAPLADVSHLPHVIFWIWLHVLQFDTSNQTLEPKEDEYNKKDRPLPARRISLRNALILRWVSVPMCWALSACYSIETVYASVALCILTYAYNEMGLAAGHWFGRNVVNALGFLSFEVGACLVSGTNRRTLDGISTASVVCSAGILATTIQAQDFKDIEGDRLVGRRTLPIVAPTIARRTLMLGLLAWSVGLSTFWGLSIASALSFSVLAFSVGVRYLVYDNKRADQRSFYLYNVWLSVAHALPAYYRFNAMASI